MSKILKNMDVASWYPSEQIMEQMRKTVPPDEKALLDNYAGLSESAYLVSIVNDTRWIWNYCKAATGNPYAIVKNRTDAGCIYAAKDGWFREIPLDPECENHPVTKRIQKDLKERLQIS